MIYTRHGSCSETVCPAGSSQNRKELSPVKGRRFAQASLTLEAACALPFFMMICAAIISFLVILSLQMNIQIRMEETARIMGKGAFLLNHTISSDAPAAGNGQSIGAEEHSVMNAGLNSASVKLIMLSSGSFSGDIQRSRIRGGIFGLYTHGSSYSVPDGILDIVVNYDYSVPWVPQSFGLLRLAQRMRCHAWVGRPLAMMAGGTANNGRGISADTDKVYVTPTGSVYHTSPDCNYLDLSIHAASSSELPGLRNAGGAKYSECPLCAGAGKPDTVFITDYGTDWHTSLECSGLKRTVMEKERSEVEGMRMCTKCKNKEHEHD